MEGDVAGGVEALLLSQHGPGNFDVLDLSLAEIFIVPRNINIISQPLMII